MSYDGICIGKIHVDLSVYKRCKDRVLNVLKGIHNFIVVIDIYKTSYKLLILVLLHQSAEFSYIEKINCDNYLIILVLCLIFKEYICKVHTSDIGIEDSVAILYVHCKIFCTVKYCRCKLWEVRFDSLLDMLLICNSDDLIEL